MREDIKERIEICSVGKVPDGYKKCIASIIPNDWNEMDFCECATIQSGLVDPKKQPYSDMKHIGPENIEKDTGRIVNVVRAKDQGLISGKFAFDENSIIYSKVRPKLNKVCMPEFDGICSADCYVMQVKENINKEYLYWFILSEYFLKQAIACSMRTKMPKVGMTVLVEYLKEKGIAVGGRKVEQEHVKCDSAKMVGKYATGLGMMEIKQNNKNELVTKVSKIPIRLCLCTDGYYQCTPVKAIHKIPVFKRSIQGMRLKPVTYMGEDIMLFEQAGKYHKTKGVIGCKYEQTDIQDSFRAACGNYMIADEMFKDIKCKCQLKVEGEVLMLEIAALNVKLNSCLKVVGEDLAILQGFGRLAREMVKLQRREDGYYLTFSGVVFKKIQIKKP